MRITSLAFWVVGLVFVLLGCDSQSNIEDPNKSFFIKFYGKDGDQTGRDMVVLPDGSIVLFGTTKSTLTSKGKQWYLVKVDANGNVLWEREFGGSLDEEASDIELTNDNRLVVVGNSYKTATDRDVLIMTLTTDGIKIDSSLLVVRDGVGFPTTGDENAVSVTQTTDGFLIAGSTTYVGLKAPVLGMTDASDALKIRVFDNLTNYPNSWVQTYGYFSHDASQKIIQVSPSLFYVFGYTNRRPPTQLISSYNFWVYSLGSNGDFLNQEHYIGTPSGDEELSSFALSPAISTEGYFLGGLTQNSNSTSDFYIAKLRKDLTFFILPSVPVNDILFEKQLSVRLGRGLQGRSSVFPSQSGGFFVLGDENGFNNDQNWVLTKVNLDGTLAWTIPIVFGGEGFDECGAVQELPDGRIILIGTMRTGRPDVGEFKMTLVKVSANGMFEN